MTLDTVFDLASLDEGGGDHHGRDDAGRAGAHPAQRLRWRRYVPGFERYGKGDHHRPPPADARVGAASRRRSRIRGPATTRPSSWRANEVPTSAPGRAVRLQRHQLLPARRHRHAGHRPVARRLHAADVLRAARHARHRVPAGPGAAAAHRAHRALRRRSTPGRASVPSATPLRGVVHDPTARRMGGIAGHAGLFSTARDLHALPACCSAAARSTACACCRRRRSRA